MTLKLGVGKKYRTRDGRIATVVSEHQTSPWPFRGKISGVGCSWKSTGEMVGYERVDPRDLIEEIVDPKDDPLHQMRMDATLEAHTELFNAMRNWPAHHSAHESYGILMEEVRELEHHVFTKQKNRDIPAMRKEAIQVAAMALRFAIEVCNEEVGRR